MMNFHSYVTLLVGEHIKETMSISWYIMIIEDLGVQWHHSNGTMKESKVNHIGRPCHFRPRPSPRKIRKDQAKPVAGARRGSAETHGFTLYPLVDLVWDSWIVCGEVNLKSIISYDFRYFRMIYPRIPRFLVSTCQFLRNTAGRAMNFWDT